MTNVDMSEDSKRLHPKAVEDIAVWATSVLSSNERASQVLRLHALTEHYLDRLLSLRLRNSSAVTEDIRFSYYHKRVLADALDLLPENISECLKRLNALRNKCAHSSHPAITDAEIAYAAKPIEAEYQQALKDQEKDGDKRNKMSAFAWALFSEMTLRITPLEIAFEDLKIA